MAPEEEFVFLKDSVVEVYPWSIGGHKCINIVAAMNELSVVQNTKNKAMKLRANGGEGGI